MATNEQDAELQVIQSLIEQLDSLEDDARTRVVTYLLQRFAPGGTSPKRGVLDLPVHFDTRAKHEIRRSSHKDIRSLKDEKNPRSANEMAALVALYLAELAPEGERKETITQQDVEKYFKLAVYPLPKYIAMTLVNAKSSGYLDSTNDPGQYKLNPVGYNLIAHTLPRTSKARRPVRKTRGGVKKVRAATV